MNKDVTSLAILNESLKKIVEYVTCPYLITEKKFPFTLAKLQSLFGGDIDESTIIEREHQELLQEWLPSKTNELTLLYRATRDGFNASSFHDKCDGKGSTLTIAKSSSGHVFGGYAVNSWN